MNIKQLSTYVELINFGRLTPTFLEIQMFKAFFYKKPIILFKEAEPYEYPSFNKQIVVEQINHTFKITEREESIDSTREKIYTVPLDKYFVTFNKMKNYLLKINAQEIPDRVIMYLLTKKGEVPFNIDILFKKALFISKKYKLDNLQEESIEETFNILKNFPPIDILPEAIHQVRIVLNNPYVDLLPLDAVVTDKIFRYERCLDKYLYLMIYIFIDIKSRSIKRRIRDVVIESKIPLNNIKFNRDMLVQTVPLDNEILLHYTRIISNERVQRLNFEPSKRGDGTFINKNGLGKYAILPKNTAEKTVTYRYKPQYTIHNIQKQFSLFVDTNKLIEKQTAYIIPKKAVLNLKNITLSCYLSIKNVKKRETRIKR